MAHEHDRFLCEKDGFLHFGCVNPFCGHGAPALPKHYTIPLDSEDVTMRLISHEKGKVRIEVTPKGGEYGSRILESEDNLEDCGVAFSKLDYS